MGIIYIIARSGMRDYPLLEAALSILLSPMGPTGSANSQSSTNSDSSASPQPGDHPRVTTVSLPHSERGQLAQLPTLPDFDVCTHCRCIKIIR
jgi:hypothetical protein